LMEVTLGKTFYRSLDEHLTRILVASWARESKSLVLGSQDRGI
jgi:hypothetical protein